MASEWRRELNGWLQEHMLATSAVIAIISGFMFFIGTIGQWYSDSSIAPTAILDFLGDWDIWVLIVGFIIFGFSVYYFWDTKNNMMRFEEMVSTSSKKEFQKNWTELEQLARYQLPKEYRKRVAEAREKFGLR
jgi:hypothetical protein|tara:strand:+ start:1745 stop:2143 length:399 start_codon:yes stop_codon:yes gene_type:complete